MGAEGSFAFCLLNVLCVNPSGVTQEGAVLDIAGGLAVRRQNSQSTVCIAFPTSGGRYGKQRGTVPKSLNFAPFQWCLYRVCSAGDRYNSNWYFPHLRHLEGKALTRLSVHSSIPQWLILERRPSCRTLSNDLQSLPCLVLSRRTMSNNV